jgi:hypothetical protein
MPVYTDPQDIRQHLRGAQQLAVPQIAEIMQEVESYVSQRLDLSPLPANNDILKEIIRELTSSRVILDLLNPTNENLARAEMHERRGMGRLRDADRHGIAPNNYADRDYTAEVIVQPEYPAWTAEDFQP